MDGDERSEAPSASAPEAQSLKPKAKQAVVIGTACSSPKPAFRPDLTAFFFD